MSDIRDIISAISIERLKEHVSALEGERHGRENYDALEEKGRFVEAAFRSLGLPVTSQPVPFKGREYRNIIATMAGSDPRKEWLLLGAHYDSPWGSPGADDNASGTAALLEASRILSEQKFSRTIQFVAFTLEELQTQTHLILEGSRHFAKDAKRMGVEYAAVLILECVGYTDKRAQSQIIPSLIGIDVPKSADFLGVIADKRSKKIMESFHTCAATWVPELKVISYAVPFSGYLIPQTRFSDHASFWNQGYPALMLTDTAMFRNPHYHTSHDTAETLDFQFLADVTKAAVSFILKLCGDDNSD